MTSSIPGRAKKESAKDKVQKTRLPSLTADAKAAADAKARWREVRNWNVRLPVPLVERAWGAIERLNERPGEVPHTTVSFTVMAFEQALERLEAEYNNGQQFHADKNPVGSGRPPSYPRP